MNIHQKFTNTQKVLKKYKGEETVLGTHIYIAGEKVTKARLRVLSELSRIHEPMSIKALSERITDHNMSTIYRTLETLATAGLVKKIALSAEESLYETTIDRPHHHHIVCTRCGFLRDVQICADLPSQKALSSKGFASMTDHSLEIFGICKKCAEPAG